ncbi:PilZ domain-containing protein [Micromonosporaceae bacterium Da 78-11]
MSTGSLPADGSYIEMTSYGETLPEVRVVHAESGVITLSLALDDVPPAGSTVTVRWAAAPRGRYATPADVVAVDGNRVDVRFAGEPAIEQARNFVRGGGGEPLVLVRPGQEPATGFVHDLSERAIRAHFTDVELRPGQEMLLRIQLGDEVVEFPATATKVSSMRQQVPRRGPLSVEMVAVFSSKDEHQAKIIRRYVLRYQLLARSRGTLL